jgi:predicted ATPase
MATASRNDLVPGSDERTKPAFLRRVRIEGYKSIAFCDVALQPLTILVGRNSSGKSNFLDALAFLRDVLAGGTDEAVRLHGGRKAILPRAGRSSVVSIAVEAGYQNEVTQESFSANYEVSVKLPNRARPVVLTEQIRIKTTREAEVIGFDRRGERVRWVGFPNEGLPAWIDRSPADRLMLGIYGGIPFMDLSLRLLFSGFYNFSPEAIRELREPTPGSMLERNGRNLASVIESIREVDKDVHSRIQAYLSSIVDEIEGFRIVHYGEYETIRFVLRADGGKPLAFDAASMSDGTLRALAALVAAFQIQSPSGPSVVGIEEPETALHPAAMRALVDALDEATGRSQILLTTHSADLLADRSLNASQVLVVRNREGQTQITPVDAASREILEKGLYSLADLQRQDLLDLDEKDLRRQAVERSVSRGA